VRPTLGGTGGPTESGSHSIVRTDSPETALALARQAQSVRSGGAVEVGLLADLPTGAPASVLGDKLRDAPPAD
jgi:hypothetical protein